ncbi:HCNGP-like protein-domain-containing protein [Pavlovales sp. CCMP2436]|nr:HCNGP-like protein-domain-containing protein [Pavlovales sp. CCMP2436]
MSLLALTAYNDDSDEDGEDGGSARESPLKAYLPDMSSAPAPSATEARGAQLPEPKHKNFALLPEVDAPVPRAVQDKVQALHSTMKQGHSVNKHIREAKMFRNPDLLAKLVHIFGVDQRGTNFAPHIFAPHAFPPHMFYKELEVQRSKWAETELRRVGQAAAAEYAARIPGGRAIPFASGGMEAQPAAPGQSAAAAAKAARRSKWDSTITPASTPPPPGAGAGTGVGASGAGAGGPAEKKRDHAEQQDAAGDDAEKRRRR